jgi:hypothetical protein
MQITSTLPVTPVANTDANQYFLEMQPATGLRTNSLYVNQRLGYSPINNTLYIDNLRYSSNNNPWTLPDKASIYNWSPNNIFVSNSLGYLTTTSNIQYYAANNTLIFPANNISNSALTISTTLSNVITMTGNTVINGNLYITQPSSNSGVFFSDGSQLRSANTTVTIQVFGSSVPGISGDYLFTPFMPKPMTLQYVTASIYYPFPSGFANSQTFIISVNGRYSYVPGLVNQTVSTAGGTTQIFYPTTPYPIPYGANVILILNTSNIYGSANSVVFSLGLS